ncbi:MAG TPA: PfkB family carbohydrate kinase [Solirubrobacteraceae bacterium]|nr:PfkB family carbohydrate kinase [Solirubrobacteraceae bacterium]
MAVGHVTADVLSVDAPAGERQADGTRAAGAARRPGGGAFYSGLQAARLGLRTLLITRGSPAELDELLEPYREEFEVRVFPAERTTTLSTSWPGGVRTQQVLAWAGPITERLQLDTSILHFAPVARETPSSWHGRAEFVGLTPQGLIREWDEHGQISLRPPAADSLPERCDALVLSAAERESCAGLLADAATRGATVAVTDGARPTTLLLPDGKVMHTPVPVGEHPRDDLGAGDVFAAAFFIALRDGQDPGQAAAYASAAAAIRIEGDGPSAIGERNAIERRIAAS